jgi:MraZ protein
VASFRGTFEFTLDAKSRLTIPSKYRASFADGVTLAAGVESCVGIWRTEDYDAWVDSVLDGRSPLAEDYRQLSRYLSSNAINTELDGAGRVMVPPFLMRHADLEREVALVGTGKAFELWTRDAWSAYNGNVVQNIADIAAGFGS